ncbi:MAG: hypothetical protein Q9220_007608 [cf. Caloplaca sp. 1 TL-2023]
MASNSTNTTDPAEVWRQLKINHIYDNDTYGAKLGAERIAAAEEIINGFRHSTMKDEEVSDLAQALKEYGTAGELTFLIKLWEVLLKKDRPQQKGKTDEEWVTTAWAKDGLRANWQEHFAVRWVPQLEAHEDEYLTWLYEDAPKVKTPYPKIAYGYTRSSCAGIIADLADHFDAILSRELYFPWLFVEAKSSAQPFEACRFQNACGGATGVKFLQDFFAQMTAQIAKHEKIAKKSHQQTSGHAKNISADVGYPYVDTNPLAIVFSLGVCPRNVELCVHFAEQHDAETTYYHMHTIGEYFLGKPADLKELRKHINNILDWGLTTRKQDLEERFAQFYQRIGFVARKRKAEEAGIEHSGDK